MAFQAAGGSDLPEDMVRVWTGRGEGRRTSREQTRVWLELSFPFSRQSRVLLCTARTIEPGQPRPSYTLPSLGHSHATPSDREKA